MARSANLHVLVYTTTQRDTVPSCIYMVHCNKHTVWLLHACGGETQQELTPFKHKEWSVVELVLSELTVSGIGDIRRHGA